MDMHPWSSWECPVTEGQDHERKGRQLKERTAPICDDWNERCEITRAAFKSASILRPQSAQENVFPDRIPRAPQEEHI